MSDEASTPDPTTGEQMIPYSRFRQVVDERNALREQVAALKIEHTDAIKRAEAEAAQHRQAAEDAAKELETLRGESEWASHAVHLAREGVVAEDVADFIRYHWQRHTPAEGEERPAFGDWLGQFRESRPHLFGAPAAAAEPSKPRPVPPRANAGAKAPPPVSAFTPERIAGMSLDEWRANKAAIKAELGVAPKAAAE